MVRPMPHIRVRDIEIYYEIHGSGPRLFFIGGSGGDLRDKPNVFDGPLTRQFEVLSYDQRGLGRTDAPEGPYTMADYAEDAAELLRVLAFDDPALMGVSFGGMVAQELLCRDGEIVSRVVLACTSAGGRAGASYPLHELEELSPRDRAARMVEISDTRFGAQWQRDNPAKAKAVIDVAMERAGSRDQAALAGQHLQLEARSHHDTSERLGGVQIPVYLCAGRYDAIAPSSNQHALEAALSNVTLEFFEGGHLFLLQDRSAFTKIADFLSGSDSR
ncbi:MAG: alpha/beta fold hydrolase [Proteobacteria bacterium]|nr:alpha/beta fold hydrolase [Pseudomonadota bacterium]